MAKKATNPKTPAKDKKAKAAKLPKEKKVSALDAAAQVLAKAGEPMNCVQLIEAMSKAGLWSSPNGATPQATLYSAITREINTKGKDARFKKTERGHFAAK
jgi:HB1, ASXL, restriction endonuclease HTH domain